MTNQNEKTNDQVVVHKKYRMGVAPYTYIGVWSTPSRSMLEKEHVAYYRAINERPKCCNFFCDHCGMNIDHHYIIKDSEGKNFVVGSSCIEKIGEVKLVEKAKKAERDRINKKNRERSQLAREKRAEKRIEDKKEKEAIERQNNNGLTNQEVKKQFLNTLKTKLFQKRVSLFSEITEALKDLNSDFADSLTETLIDNKENYFTENSLYKSKRLPSEKQCFYIVELIAKGVGKKGSKVFKEKEAEVKEALNEGIEKFKTLLIEIQKEEEEFLKEIK